MDFAGVDERTREKVTRARGLSSGSRGQPCASIALFAGGDYSQPSIHNRERFPRGIDKSPRDVSHNR